MLPGEILSRRGVDRRRTAVTVSSMLAAGIDEDTATPAQWSAAVQAARTEALAKGMEVVFNAPAITLATNISCASGERFRVLGGCTIAMMDSATWLDALASNQGTVYLSQGVFSIPSGRTDVALTFEPGCLIDCNMQGQPDVTGSFLAGDGTTKTRTFTRAIFAVFAVKSQRLYFGPGRLEAINDWSTMELREVDYSAVHTDVVGLRGGQNNPEGKTVLAYEGCKGVHFSGNFFGDNAAPGISDGTVGEVLDPNNRNEECVHSGLLFGRQVKEGVDLNGSRAIHLAHVVMIDCFSSVRETGETTPHTTTRVLDRTGEHTGVLAELEFTSAYNGPAFGTYAAVSLGVGAYVQSNSNALFQTRFEKLRVRVRSFPSGLLPRHWIYMAADALSNTKIELDSDTAPTEDAVSVALWGTLSPSIRCPINAGYNLLRIDAGVGGRIENPHLEPPSGATTTDRYGIGFGVNANNVRMTAYTGNVYTTRMAGIFRSLPPRLDVDGGYTVSLFTDLPAPVTGRTGMVSVITAENLQRVVYTSGHWWHNGRKAYHWSGSAWTRFYARGGTPPIFANGAALPAPTTMEEGSTLYVTGVKAMLVFDGTATLYGGYDAATNIGVPVYSWNSGTSTWTFVG